MVITTSPCANPGAVTMNRSTSLTILPIAPCLPCGLILLLILSLLLQSGLMIPTLSQPVLPALTTFPGRCHAFHPRLRSQRRVAHCYRRWDTFGKMLPRLLARSAIIVTLVYTSSWMALSPWAYLILLLPFAQIVLTLSPWFYSLQKSAWEWTG